MWNKRKFSKGGYDHVPSISIVACIMNTVQCINILLRNPCHNHPMAWTCETDEQSCNVSSPVLGCGGWCNEEVWTYQSSKSLSLALSLSLSLSDNSDSYTCMYYVCS